MRQFHVLFSLLPYKLKLLTTFAVIAGCFASVLEVVGIASVAPFLQFASTGTLPSFITDYLSVSGDKYQILFCLGVASCLLIMASFIFSQLFMLGTYFLAFKKVGFYFSTRMFEKCFEMPISYSSRLDSSFLVKLISQDANFNIIHAIYVSGVVLVTKLFLMFAIILGLFFIDPMQSLFVITFFSSLYLLIYFVLRPRLANIGLSISESSKGYMRLVHDVIATIREIKIWNKEDNVNRQFRELLLSRNHPEFLYNSLSQVPKPLVESVTFIGIVLSCLYVSEIGGDVNKFVSRIAVFIIAAYRLIPALQQIFLCFSSARANSVSLSNVENYLNLYSGRKVVSDITMPFNSNDKSLSGKQGLVELRNVCVSSDLDGYILEKINLKIYKGERIAFVGPSGSGKTTCLNTLLGVQTISSGDFFIDDDSFNHHSDWSNNCSLVSQDVYLTDESLNDNVAFFSDGNINYERVKEVCNVACIDFIDDFNAKLGIRGGRLSGGQKQRVGIARALYKSSKLLAMDEATSALDNETERKLMRNLIDYLDKDKCLIMVVHKIDLLCYFDRVIIFNDGKIECEGSLEYVSYYSKVFNRLKVSQ